MKRIVEVKTTTDKLVLKKRVKAYFKLQGFDISEENDDKLIFKRGNIFLNMVTFDPLKWKSLTTVYFSKGSVHTNFDIDSTFQIVTKEEEKLWDNFFLNFQKTLETGDSFIEQNNMELESVKDSQWKYLGFSALGVIGLGIPVGIFCHFFGKPIFGLYAIIGGGVLLLMYKVNAERKKN